MREAKDGPNPQSPWGAYLGASAALVAALALPIGLMIGNPTLMFERGWEQYVGTTIYFAAVLTLVVELVRLRRQESAFRDYPRWSEGLVERTAQDARLLAARVRQLVGYASATRTTTRDQLLEINRETSGLDQEHAAGRFTLVRYSLYLLPVIGFIGTVEGISHALRGMGPALKGVKVLDDFLTNLDAVTSALQIAFDSTLLALFLSASLMLVLTLVHRRSEDLLARVDRWSVENAVPNLGREPENAEAVLGRLIEAVGCFTSAVERFEPTLEGFERGAQTLGRLAEQVEESRRAMEELVRIRAGIERAGDGIDVLSRGWVEAFERSNRTTNEQLARSLTNLKDALDLLHVSVDQSNALYRNIVRKMFDERLAA